MEPVIETVETVETVETPKKKYSKPKKYPTEEELKLMNSNQRSYYKNRDKRLIQLNAYGKTPEGKVIRNNITKKWNQNSRNLAKEYKEILKKEQEEKEQEKEEEKDKELPKMIQIMPDLVVIDLDKLDRPKTPKRIRKPKAKEEKVEKIEEEVEEEKIEEEVEVKVKIARPPSKSKSKKVNASTQTI